ncbi:PucR family transcriptional regulator [Pseudonocardia acaciae]|uniref:PucR family transcriptional regulator n=1 Tax=Pseudonocardia acaciae TaxID=551276 RepID=UPI000490A565|nr:PucR family transcriptional regulator ligand-binding domain-containing protein [Pseudonocardia acaciae]
MSSVVLGNPVFQRTAPRLLVGDDQRERPIRWVHSTDVFEVASLLRGGELLLTTGIGLASADANRRRHYVRGLAEVGLGALALELGWTFSEVPDDMVEEAARYELPLIALRQLVPFVEITEAINAAIVDSSIVGLRFADRMSQALSDALAHGASLDQLLDRLSELVAAPAMLVGPDGTPIGWTGEEGTAAALLAEGGCSATVSVDGVPFASLVVGDPGARTRELVRDALDRACPAFALQLLGSRAELATMLHAGRQLVQRLAAGDRSPALASLASAVGLPTERASYLVAVVDGLFARGPTVLREAATRLGARHAVTTLDGQAVALIAMPADPGRAPLDDRVAEELAAHLPRTDQPRAAVGTVADDLAGAAESLRQARAAFQVGSVVSGTGPVAAATRLTAERLLLRLPAAELEALVSEHLGGLVALPAPRRDELLATLETYLANAHSKSTTARLLRLRRQSLYQRLRRIRTLLGRDIDEPAIATGLALAVRAWRIQRSVPVTR